MTNGKLWARSFEGAVNVYTAAKLWLLRPITWTLAVLQKPGHECVRMRTRRVSRSQPVSFENDFFSAWWIRLSLFFFALSRYIKRCWRHSWFAWIAFILFAQVHYKESKDKLDSIWKSPAHLTCRTTTRLEAPFSQESSSLQRAHSLSKLGANPCGHPTSLVFGSPGRPGDDKLKIWKPRISATSRQDICEGKHRGEIL